jgi:hypothetical protein
MSDRTFLALIGMTFGVTTFAAAGVAASLVMSEVQSRALHASTPAADSVTPAADSVHFAQNQSVSYSR